MYKNVTFLFLVSYCKPNRVHPKYYDIYSILFAAKAVKVIASTVVEFLDAI
jgi:hypothetical protein